MVSTVALGDVVGGTLKKGQSAYALCFIREALTSAGFTGSVIKIRSGDVSGYAAVTDFPKDPADRKTMFSLDEDTLRARLPFCAH